MNGPIKDLGLMEGDLGLVEDDLRAMEDDLEVMGEDLRLMEDNILNPLITFGQRLNTACSCLWKINMSFNPTYTWEGLI